MVVRYHAHARINAMEKIITREELMDVDYYKEMFEIEFHHDHEIIMDQHGVARWKADPKIRLMIGKTVDLNDLWYIMFCSMGFTKNSEEVRKLYRDMGYSLSGYWEVFFWEVNNEQAPEYRKAQLRKKAAQRRKATSVPAA